MNHNLDELFKKALKDKTNEPPPYIWENINRELNHRKHPAAIWWFRGIAAAALVAAVLSIRLLHTDTNPRLHVAKVIPADAVLSHKYPLAALAYGVADRHHHPETYSVAPATVDKSQEKFFTPVLHPTTEALAIPHQLPVPSLREQVLCRNFIPLTSREALENNEKYRALLEAETPVSKPEKNILRFEISGHFTPAYSSGSYSSDIKSPRGRNYSEDQMNGRMNTGGGLRFTVAAGKRFSVQTGLSYSRMGQKTRENISSRQALASASALQNSEKVMPTPLGNVKRPTKAVAYRSPQVMVMNSVGNYNQTIEQTFSTLAVPLHLRYRLNNNKILFSVIGGFSGNFIVNNKVYLKSGKEREFLGSTEDIRPFNLSTDWSLGMEYPLTPKIKIMIEPGIKYYLQSLSENDDIDFKPYLFTLSTGIGIAF